MNKGQWTVIVLIGWLVGFAGGYLVSARTGSEPGYFDAVEAAGYGGGAELIEGVSSEMQQYYESLLQTDEE